MAFLCWASLSEHCRQQRYTCLQMLQVPSLQFSFPWYSCCVLYSLDFMHGQVLNGLLVQGRSLCKKASEILNSASSSSWPSDGSNAHHPSISASESSGHSYLFHKTVSSQTSSLSFNARSIVTHIQFMLMSTIIYYSPNITCIIYETQFNYYQKSFQLKYQYQGTHRFI